MSLSSNNFICFSSFQPLKESRHCCEDTEASGIGLHSYSLKVTLLQLHKCFVTILHLCLVYSIIPTLRK